MKKIVFIHGMFVTNRCWNEWMEYFTRCGFECVAPAWPLKDFSPSELRAKHPDFDGEGKMKLADIVLFFEKHISQMKGNTILIGHSLGGLIVQILLSKGLGSAGVAIDSAPPKGVLTTKLSFLKSNWPVLNPFSPRAMPLLLTKNQFQYAFAYHLNGSLLDHAYEGVVPQSKLVGLGALTNVAKIDFTKKKAPLLFIAGERDNIIPATLNKSNYRKYARNNSRTDFKIFPRRTHYLINDDGWQAIADYILNWLNRL
jgi:pimeloyl-ACP methyl ester carboxylesterase